MQILSQYYLHVLRKVLQNAGRARTDSVPWHHVLTIPVLGAVLNVKTIYLHACRGLSWLQ